MRISRIYTHASLQSLQLVTLEEKPSHHLSKVLRLKAGARVVLFNGNGHDYHGHIDSVDKKSVSVRIDEQQLVENESPLKIHLGIAVSRGDRMDWIIQKATELGVDQINPLLSERTAVSYNHLTLPTKRIGYMSVAGD